MKRHEHCWEQLPSSRPRLPLLHVDDVRADLVQEGAVVRHHDGGHRPAAISAEAEPGLKGKAANSNQSDKPQLQAELPSRSQVVPQPCHICNVQVSCRQDLCSWPTVNTLHTRKLIDGRNEDPTIRLAYMSTCAVISTLRHSKGYAVSGSYCNNR